MLFLGVIVSISVCIMTVSDIQNLFRIYSEFRFIQNSDFIVNILTFAYVYVN